MRPALLGTMLAVLGSTALAAPTGIVENLNEALPLDLTFTDQNGSVVKLAQYFQPGRPVLITPVYFGCPVLCSTVLRGVVSTLRDTGLELGVDYEVVTYSIDPSETPAQAQTKRREVLQELGVEEGTRAWSFLTGTEDTVRALSEKLGFQYQYDAQLKQYVHSAGFMLVTPDGHVSRYLYGVRFPPRDVRLGLVEAADGRVGTSFDRFLLACTRYDPKTQKYRPWIWGIIRGGGTLVFAALGLTLLVFWRRELRFGSGRRPLR